jgi:phosphoglucosamine mutase
MQMFGTSGIRRVVDRNLLELAQKTGLAVGRFHENVVVGCDTRTSSDALKHAFISGILFSGAKAFDAGVLPTPTLALAGREFNAGAMITASHNPSEYNGMKLVNPDGSAFDTEQQEEIESLIVNDSISAVTWDEIKNSTVYCGAVEKHTSHIMRDCPGDFRLKVVLDCGCGAASVITPCLLRKMGCEIQALNSHPSGFFPHEIEPTEANLGHLMRATHEFGAALGIAHDGDADRMMVVDDRGRFVPGDKLMVILARHLGAKKLVTTIDASMLIDEMGFSVTRTKVGDTHISEELKKGGDFGGEPSGAWIFPHSSLCPDGIYAAAQIVAIASQQSLSTMVDDIPQYPLLRGSVAGSGLAVSELGKRLAVLKPLSIDDSDGIKLNFKDGWLLVRPSGTEPKIRITAEAKTETRVHELYNSGLQAIKEGIA